MPTTLYERLGGRESISAVVDEFYNRVLADDRVNHFFDDTNMLSLRGHQTRFIASVASGPEDYDGRDLSEAHAHLDIDGRDFAIIATHLDEALAAFDVPEGDREELLGAVGDLEPVIVSAA